MPSTDATERGADEKEHDAHALPPVQIAELSVERRDHRLREQIRGDDRRQVRESAELADDCRQRSGDDRGVERREQHRQEQSAEANHHALAIECRAWSGE